MSRSETRLVIFALTGVWALLGCPLIDTDVYVPPTECTPEEEQCVSATEMQKCDEFGEWGETEPVVPCTYGACMVMEGYAMCM